MKNHFKIIADTIHLAMDSIVSKIPKKLSELEIDTELGAKSWNDLEGRPFYERDNKTNIYLDEQNFDGFVDWSGGLYAKFDVELSLNSAIERGKTYTINWDGVEYISELKETENGLYLGFNAYGSIHDDYPFGIWFSMSNASNNYNASIIINSIYTTSTESSHTISIYEGGLELKKLDAKFLPDTVLYQGDWDEKNPDSVNYIRNKPFGEIEIPVNIIPEQLLTITSSYIQIKPNIPQLIAGKTYLVVFNGVEYKCIARTCSGYVLIGNGIIYGDGHESNGEPFSCDSHSSGTFYVNVLNKGEYTFSMSEFVTDIKPIDKKFLHDIAAQSELDNISNTKMNNENPVGSGSFSMNRKEGLGVGEYSSTFGNNLIAENRSQFVSGEFNININKIKYSESEICLRSSNTVFSKSGNFYYSTEYEFDENTGVYTLIAPSLATSEQVKSLYGKNQWFIVDTTSSSHILTPDVFQGNAISKFAVQGKNHNTNYNRFSTSSYKYSIKADIINSERGEYVHIVGNGTSDTERSNAHTLDWEGNAEFAGDIVAYGCGGDEPISLRELNEKVSESSSVITVNITGDDENGYSADKTFEEVLDAYEDNKVIMCKLNNLYYHLNEYFSQVVGTMTISSFMFYCDDISAEGVTNNVISIGKNSSFEGTNVDIMTSSFTFADIINNNIPTLTTTDKTIIGAINELDTDINILLANKQVINITEQVVDMYFNFNEVDAGLYWMDTNAYVQIQNKGSMETGLFLVNKLTDSIAQVSCPISGNMYLVNNGTGSLMKSNLTTNSTHNNLETTDKTIVGAINEVNEKAENATVSDEKIIELVEGYFVENPIETGATAEQIAQINKNTSDISKFGGTVEITHGEPEKENTILTIDPDAENVNIYVAEEIDKKFSQLQDAVDNLGRPTDEQVRNAINNYLEENPIGNIVGGGLNVTARNLLITILRNALYSTNQNSNITLLESALTSGGDNGGNVTPTYYLITNNLTNATTSNNATTIEENQSYNASLSIANGYVLKAVNVVMGGVDVTSTVYSNGQVNIPKVTGNVVITVVAVNEQSEKNYYTITNDLTNVSSSNTASNIEENYSYNSYLSADNGYTLEGATVTVTMGGIDITSSVYSNGTILIESVTGNVVITVVAVKESLQTETLEITWSESYPNTTTFEYQERETPAAGQNYTVVKQGKIKGGLLEAKFDDSNVKGFSMNIYIFDENGNPYLQTGSGQHFEGLTEPNYKGVGEASGFGVVDGQFSIQLPKGCTCIMCLRRGNITSTDGTTVISNITFGNWVMNGGITFTVTG